MRLEFWLRVMDLTELVFGFGSRQYLWAVGKASDATDWGEGVDLGGEEPW